MEGRVPFLDKEFMDVAMRLNPSDKMAKEGRMEKWILRKAFEDLLPESIAWRQKEQFSDGVGYSWIDTLRALANEKVTDEQMANARHRFPVNPPLSKEEYHYRSIFSEHFPSDQAAACVPSVPSVACSTPVALEWDASDATARHFLVMVDGKPAACARVLEVGHFGRMAVLPEWRGQGIGEALLLQAIQECRHLQALYARLSAQTQAVKFYERAGFVVCSEPYLDANIMHVDMQLELV